MIPFEEEASLNSTEEYVEGLLEKQWDNVVRSTPGIVEDLKTRYPEIGELISQRILEDTESELSNLFRPGVPDFLVFDDTGDYLFVEVKSSNDNLRHTQLKWLRDFKGVNMEIWFSEEEIEKLEASKFSAYGFNDVKGSTDTSVEKENKKLKISIPDELASITGLSEGDSVNWRLKSVDELILDTR